MTTRAWSDLFDVSENGTPYKHFRINVTTNQAGGAATALTELEFNSVEAASILSVETSQVIKGCLYSAFYFANATTVPESTVQFVDGDSVSPQAVSFPWSPEAGKALYSILHVGGVGSSDPLPVLEIPDNTLIYGESYIKAFGGGRNAGPAYSLYKPVSEASEANDFVITYDSDGAFDDTFCSFRVE